MQARLTRGVHGDGRQYSLVRLSATAFDPAMVPRNVTAPADVALVTERRYEQPTVPVGGPERTYVENILEEDRLLQEALAKRGLTSERVAWTRPDVDWSRYRCVVLRTPWDYFESFAPFMRWIEAVSSATELKNGADLVRWNVDKRYLLELAGRGVPTVPTVLVEAGGDDTDLAVLLAREGWDEAVIKPAVSGAARHTYRVRADALGEHAELFAALTREEAMLVQPFVASVPTHGEVTVVWIDGEPTHAIKKRAREGDFRVQDDHGGTVHDHAATEAELDVARRALAACPDPDPLYGRVDLVAAPAAHGPGEPWVSELELVEPELWLRCAPAAAERFAAALARSLDQGGRGPAR